MGRIEVSPWQRTSFPWWVWLVVSGLQDKVLDTQAGRQTQPSLDGCWFCHQICLLATFWNTKLLNLKPDTFHYWMRCNEGEEAGRGRGRGSQSEPLALRKSAYVVVFHKIFPPRTSEWIIFINLFVDNYLVNGVTNVYVTSEHHVMFFNVKKRNYHI